MKNNVGSYDAGVRFILGCVVLFFSVNGLGWWGLLGLIPIASAACGFCPAYWLLRIDTAAWEEAREHQPHDEHERMKRH
jgi:hypothetical protein